MHFYLMYLGNLRVEGDGMPFPELNLLRLVLLYPIIFVVMGINLLIDYNYDKPTMSVIYLAHAMGFVVNIIRIVLSSVIFVVEVAALPFRIVIGTLLSPLALYISAGHIYAIGVSAVHFILF